ncbi:MAG: flagellar biosynthesis protein FlgM [marine bacterium B5-7]|nr:MAG: flagellar biosynthesis protein FlgM [marine bacterium B5-7]
MNSALWVTYVTAILLMMSTPGPSQLLMLSNSLSNGFRRSLATAAGDLSANVLQMLAAGLGIGAIVIASETAFTVIKWAGAIYLIYMGIMRIRRAGGSALSPNKPASIGNLWMQGFVTSAANPRAVVFFAALFPQFIDPAYDFARQFAILSVTYLVIDGTFLTCYGSGASLIARHLTLTSRKWLDRFAGTFLVAAGGLLLTRSIPR